MRIGEILLTGAIGFAREAGQKTMNNYRLIGRQGAHYTDGINKSQ